MDKSNGRVSAKRKGAACVHSFNATGEKAAWLVESLPTNNRGGSRWVEVPVTVFRCSHCGDTKEYPDFWETNYIASSKKPANFQNLKSRRGRKKAVKQAVEP